MRYCEFESSALEFNLKTKGFKHTFIPKRVTEIDYFEYIQANATPKNFYLENIKHRLFNLATQFRMFGVEEEINRFEDAVIKGRECFKLKCQDANNIFYELLIYEYFGRYHGMLDKQGWVTLLEFDHIDEVLCFIPEIYDYSHCAGIMDHLGQVCEGKIDFEGKLIVTQNDKAVIYDYEAFYLQLLGMAYESLRGGQ